MLVVKIFHLGILFTVFIFIIHFNSVYASVDAKNSNSSSTGNNTSSIKPDNYAIKVGEGNNTVSVTKYFPDYVEITAGDSITWYNGVDVPNPHTVTFIRNLGNIEKIGVPFYVPNNTKFTPVLNNLGEPLEEKTSNGTRIVMMLNARALTPTVIAVDDKVMELKQNSVYALNGSEKFVNSGPLLSLDKEQNFDYSFSSSFTVVFNKPGFFEYTCLFHPWMIGKLLVKP
jgi:plastocyanin